MDADASRVCRGAGPGLARRAAVSEGRRCPMGIRFRPGTSGVCAQPPGLARSFLGRAGGWRHPATPRVHGPLAPPAMQAQGTAAGHARTQASSLGAELNHAHLPVLVSSTKGHRFRTWSPCTPPPMLASVWGCNSQVSYLPPPPCWPRSGGVTLGSCTCSLPLSSKDDRVPGAVCAQRTGLLGSCPGANPQDLASGTGRVYEVTLAKIREI